MANLPAEIIEAWGLTESNNKILFRIALQRSGGSRGFVLQPDEKLRAGSATDTWVTVSQGCDDEYFITESSSLVASPLSEDKKVQTA